MKTDEIVSRLREMARDVRVSPRTCIAAADLLENLASGSKNKIPYERRVQVYRGALEHFGRTIQMVMALEELSECQKEICKQLRGYDNLEHLAEEIADATIMLEQMRLFFGLNELVCQKMDQKVQRLEALLKENGLYGGERYEEWKESHCGAAEADDEVEAGLAGLAGG